MRHLFSTVFNLRKVYRPLDRMNEQEIQNLHNRIIPEFRVCRLLPNSQPRNLTIML